METFSALLALCKRNPAVIGGFPSQRPVTWSFDVFFDLCSIKRFKQTIETPVIWDAIALIMTSLQYGIRLKLISHTNSFVCNCFYEASLNELHVLFRALAAPFANRYFTVIWAWISNHVHYFLWNVFTNLCSNFNGGLTRPPLKRSRRWIIASTFGGHTADDYSQRIFCMKYQNIGRFWFNLIIVLYELVCNKTESDGEKPGSE